MPNYLSHKITHSSSIICCSNSLGSQTWTIVEVWFYYFRTVYYFFFFHSKSLLFGKDWENCLFWTSLCRISAMAWSSHGAQWSWCFKKGCIFSQFIFWLSDRMVGLHVIWMNVGFTPIRNKSKTVTFK